jgi:hypothetical protein
VTLLTAMRFAGLSLTQRVLIDLAFMLAGAIYWGWIVNQPNAFRTGVPGGAKVEAMMVATAISLTGVFAMGSGIFVDLIKMLRKTA